MYCNMIKGSDPDSEPSKSRHIQLHKLELTYGKLRHMALQILVSIAALHGFLLDDIKPLSETMLAHQLCRVALF